MQKYVGIKLVEARPMTRGDYNNYRGWTIPKDEDPNDDGYLVKYSDDYVSWSPKAAFDEAYRKYEPSALPQTALGMISNDYKERFKAEYYQAKIRYEKLKKFNTKIEAYERIDYARRPYMEAPKHDCPYDLLIEQQRVMENYIHILEVIAEIEGIEL